MKSSVCDQVRADLAPVLKELSSKYGVKLSLGTMRYDEAGFRATLEAVDEQVAFEKVAFLYGVKKEAYKAEIKHPKHGKIILVGFNPKASKMPLKLIIGGKSVKGARAFLRHLPKEYRTDQFDALSLSGKY